MNDRIKPLQLDASLSGCETPIDCSPICVSLGFPSQRFVCQKFSMRDISIQTLAAKNAQLDLSHIEPTAMLGCEMKLQSVQDATGFCWFEGFIQGSRCMSIQVVFNQDTSLGVREMQMNQLIDADGPVCFGALFGGLTWRQFSSGAKNMNKLAVPSRRYS